MKSKAADDNKTRNIEKENMEKELEKIRGEIERVSVQAAALTRRELQKKDELFKNERAQYEQKTSLELKKVKEQSDLIKR